MDPTPEFEAERGRLLRLAGRILADHQEAEDVVQTAWLRLHGTATPPDDLPAWLTTVTTRLCLDRLRARTPVPVEDVVDAGTEPDPVEDVLLAETVGVALQALLDRLGPRERVALVLHDVFGFAFVTVAEILECSPASARQLASRGRARLRPTLPGGAAPSDAAVVDAFMAAARGGDLPRLLELLAPGVVVDADAAALELGTPRHLQGRDAVAAFFDGAAHSALAVDVADRPAAAWYDRGEPRVLFDIAVADGRVTSIVFRADPSTLATVRRRRDTTRQEYR